MSAFLKRHGLHHAIVVGQMVVHRSELKTKKPLSKHHRQLGGELIVCQVVVHCHELKRKNLLWKHYQLVGELVVGQMLLDRRVFRAIARLQQQDRLLLFVQGK
jgi:hypothetical protein